jgi:hypothetical protein
MSVVCHCERSEAISLQMLLNVNRLLRRTCPSGQVGLHARTRHSIAQTLPAPSKRGIITSVHCLFFIQKYTPIAIGLSSEPLNRLYSLFLVLLQLSVICCLLSVNPGSLSIFHSKPQSLSHRVSSEAEFSLGSWLLVLLQLSVICCLLSVFPDSLSIFHSKPNSLAIGFHLKQYLVLALGSWLLVPGSWFLALGSWFLVLLSALICFFP